MESQSYPRSTHIWPPPESDMEDDDVDDEDPDNTEGCEFCMHKSCNPGLAWDAFYKSGYNLRDSFCIGRRCEDPAWDDSDEQEVQPEQMNSAMSITSFFSLSSSQVILLINSAIFNM